MPPFGEKERGDNEATSCLSKEFPTRCETDHKNYHWILN